uniref:Peroxidase n=1 Tax=Nelumbo nucifera TaxID=4432 RepID=A0A822Y5N5_NELNU|nr:TPA_asm: hypothetical protein HUJ06_028399 [Nelumbo nucifera]
MWELAKNLSVFLLAVSVLLSLGYQIGEPKNGLTSSSVTSTPMSHSSLHAFWYHPRVFNPKEFPFIDQPFLEYDFYRNSCPQAEYIIRSTVHQLYKTRSDVAPALLRLVFHDCFVQGCDASILLDASNGVESEKDAPPNETLKGFDLIDVIKSKLEEECPATVSCADILVLAARDGVALAGGPFYPLRTGRRDSILSFRQIAASELPSPHDELAQTLTTFATRGFDERETVTLLGAHSIGMIHCKFFRNRLFSYKGTNGPDPTLEPEFLNLMRSRCNRTGSSEPPSSTTSSEEEPGMDMDYEGTGQGFGTIYYKSLVQRRGILHADQQLMTGDGTRWWVHAYAADSALFRRDFAMAMMKLSSLQVLTAPFGQVRLNCSKIV